MGTARKSRRGEALLDPSVSELIIMLKSNSMRGLVGNRHFIAWDALEGIHAQMYQSETFSEMDKWDKSPSMHINLHSVKSVLRFLTKDQRLKLNQAMEEHPLRGEGMVVINVLPGTMDSVIGLMPMKKMFTKSKFPILLTEDTHRPSKVVYLTGKWDSINL